MTNAGPFMRINTTPFHIGIRALLFVFSLLALSPAWAAYDATTAFNDLVSSSGTGPGSYTTTTRDVFVGGSMRMWVPNTSVQLISLTPPSFSAGCGGIDAFAGGFSFINAAQFSQLIQNIMQNAKGLVVELGIRTLCPMCADILAEMQKLAQAADKMAANSCDIATNLVNEAGKGLGLVNSIGQNGQAVCQQTATNSNTSSGWFDFANTCENSANGGTPSWLTEVNGWVKDSNSWLDQIHGGPAGAALNESDVTGNKDWMLLTASGYSSTYVKEIILSVSGFNVINSNGKPQPNKGWFGSDYLKKSVGKSKNGVNDAVGRDLVSLLLFGNQPGAMSQATIASYIPTGPSDGEVAASLLTLYNQQSQAPYSNLPFYICNGPSGPAPADTPYSPSDLGVMQDCDSPTANTVSGITASQNPLIAGPGLMVYVAKTLTAAVNAIENNQQLPAGTLQLMQITPLPLYRMLNIAAVYPTTAGQLVSTYSRFIATLVAQSIVTQWMEAPSSESGGNTPGASKEAAMQAMQAVAQAISDSTGTPGGTIKTVMDTENGILAELQTVNNAIYQQMAGTGIEGNLLFTQGLATGIAQGH